jgi:hypothetical protein
LNTRAPARRYDSVQQDWRAILPYSKGALFADHTEKLENTYRMFSVALNEAIGLHRQGDWEKGIRGIEIAGEFCARLALGINAVLHAMRQHARHFGIVPNMALLEPANFHSERAQRAARHSNLVSHVLLSERSQFLNKLNTLEEMVDELGDSFIEATDRLAERIFLKPSGLWKFLDLYHFDLNTCLRETCVVLKSFLLVLPEDQLDKFDFTVCGLARTRRRYTASHLALIRARRMPAVAGE